MPWYRKHGKIQTPMTDEDFKQGMQHGHFIEDRHRGFCILEYYSAVRKKEALRCTREQFTFTHDKVLFSVGKRLKHGIETP